MNGRYATNEILCNNFPWVKTHGYHHRSLRDGLCWNHDLLSRSDKSILAVGFNPRKRMEKNTTSRSDRLNLNYQLELPPRGSVRELAQWTGTGDDLGVEFLHAGFESGDFFRVFFGKVLPLANILGEVVELVCFALLAQLPIPLADAVDLGPVVEKLGAR